MGKTKTIKKRTVYIYLPSLEDKELWEKAAKKHNTSLSKFVTSVVDDAILETEDPDYKSRGELRKEVFELHKRIQELAKDSKMKDVLLEKQEKELYRYRLEPFLNEQFEGVRQYDKQLIKTLRSRATLSDQDLLAELGIDPHESEAVRAVTKQLELLVGYGLVESTPRGWRWKG